MTRSSEQGVVQQRGGGGAVQVGHAGGNVTVINHYYAAQPEVRRDAVQRRAVREALALMDQLRNRIAVLDWMEQQLGSRMVKDLPVYKINRLQRYVRGAVRKESLNSGRGG